MCVVDQQVAVESTCGVVVDAAGAVCDIAHDQIFGLGAEGAEDVADCGRKKEEAFRKLEGDLLTLKTSNAVDGFVDLEAVVCGEESDGFINGWVVQDIFRYLIEGSGAPVFVCPDDCCRLFNRGIWIMSNVLSCLCFRSSPAYEFSARGSIWSGNWVCVVPIGLWDVGECAWHDLFSCVCFHCWVLSIDGWSRACEISDGR